MVRPYVIIGTGAAGMAAAERLRLLKPDVPIQMMSIDDHSHSRCMLHKFLGGERDEKGLSFVEEDFFEKKHIMWGKGQVAKGVDPKEKRVLMEEGYQPYEKLLIATGSVYGIPPIPNFRTAANVFGFRDLSDAQKMNEAIRELNAKHVFIVGSGLVGLDVAYALMERGIKVTIAEMADRVLPLQTDAISAKAYQDLFEKAGAQFKLGIGASDSVVDDQNRITAVKLSNGEEIPCDFVVCAAGVRPNLAFLEGSGIQTERGIVVDEYMCTSKPDIYAAGDVTALSGIWPNAMDQGRIAAANMCGQQQKYTDTFCIKNTINFFGLTMLSVGEVEPKEEGSQVYTRECQNAYQKVIVRDGMIKGVQLQGDISHSGFWQYLIKNQIHVSSLLEEKSVFDLSFGDFYGMDELGEFRYLDVS
jgi:nitrite reductase (NADH) large subunit